MGKLLGWLLKWFRGQKLALSIEIFGKKSSLKFLPEMRAHQFGVLEGFLAELML